jgi:putative inorganic carbon (HCO3(-)) transporter
MRDAILFLMIMGALPFAFKRPVIGIFLWTWVSLMNPHRLTYGFAYSFPFAGSSPGSPLSACSPRASRKSCR